MKETDLEEFIENLKVPIRIIYERRKPNFNNNVLNFVTQFHLVYQLANNGLDLRKSLKIYGKNYLP